MASDFTVQYAFSQYPLDFQIYDPDLVRGGLGIDLHVSYRTTEKIILTPRDWSGCSRHTSGDAI